MSLTFNVQLHIYATNSRLWQNVFIQTLQLKLKIKVFLNLLGMGFCKYKVVSLQHTLFFSVELIKHINVMPFFAKLSNESVTHQNTKLLETVYRFYICLMCFLWHNELLFIHSITRKRNFINIVKKCRSLFAQHIWNFAQIFDKSNLKGSACTPAPPTLAPLLNTLHT